MSFSGNTVFAALGISGQPLATHRQQFHKSLTAIGAFLIGSLFFSGLHRYPTGLSESPTSTRRLILIISFFIQTSFIAIAAALVHANEVSNQPFVGGSFSSGNAQIPADEINYLDLCPVAFLSFQAAGQIFLSRLLGFIELPTIVLSALYHDICAEIYNTVNSWRNSTSWSEFWLVHEERQLKRTACVVALFVGALSGGFMYKSTLGMQGALWLAVGLKFAITLAWFFWPAKSHDLDSTLP
jgi:uncharacterized membrane protein YoaK (UPF0700 family)